jgi:hypothetical protein
MSSFGTSVPELEELAQKMSPPAARGILGENVARAYNLM